MAIQFLNTVQVRDEDTDVLFVDAAGNRVGVGTRTPAKKFVVVEEGGEVTISSISTDTPQITMTHNPLPNDGNGISNIIFSSVNDATQSIGYASIKAYADDVTDGTEDGSIRFATMKAGAIDETLTLKSGNVGIGTTSPSTKLEISSSGVNGVDISESASNATQSGRLFFSTNTASEGFALFNSNGTLQINSGGIPNNTSGTNRISILSNGNVGVGTTSPDAKLHVFGTSEDNRGVGQGVTSVIEITNSYVTAFNRLSELIFSTSTGGGANRMSAISSAYTGQSGSNLSGDLRFSTRTVGDSALSEKIRIESDGNVGIGTTSPDSKLHVYANNADAPTVVTIENGDTAVVAGQDLAKIEFLTNDVSAPGAGVAASIRAVCQNAGNIFDLAFNTQNATTRTERMRLTGAGNLGLGTTSLTSISSTSRTLSLGSTSTTTSGGIAFQVNGVVKAYNYVTSDYLINQTVSGIGQIFYGAGSERMRINKTTGNVGINDTSPSYKLDVDGEGRFTGDLRCLSLIQTSQSDKKQSIAGIVKTKAKTIEFKEYVYKSDGANRKRYGVLAEDIEDDYPELVHVDAEGVKGINYIDLLVKRVAELEKELEDISLTQGPKGDTGAAGADGNSHLRNISSMAINSKTGQLEITIGKSTYKFNPDK